MEISLPNEAGRLQILNIHIATVREGEGARRSAPASASCLLVCSPPAGASPAWPPRRIVSGAMPQARKNGRLGPDVDLPKIAALTKNFSGAEIEGAGGPQSASTWAAGAAA